MPSVSKKQERFMAAAAHDPKFAKEAGISQATAKEWHAKDKKADNRNLPEKKASKEDWETTASLNGAKGFRDH